MKYKKHEKLLLRIDLYPPPQKKKQNQKNPHKTRTLNIDEK